MAYTGDETDPLLGTSPRVGQTLSYETNLASSSSHQSPLDGYAVRRSLGDDREIGESFDNVPRANRQLGIFSAVFLIFNRVVGTGIYATPSVILRLSGSVGMALVMWLIGALIAAVGTAVYIELGTGLPRSGGEKNYLEFIYRRPKFMVTCVFSVYAFITGSAAANSVVFGEYAVHFLSLTPSTRNTRFAAFLSLTFCLFVHGVTRKAGLFVQNTLGLSKLAVLCVVVVSGFLCLAGIPGFEVRDEYEKPRNFEWDKLWEGSGTGANAFVMGLYSVIWSFVGYANANYALSEVKDPIRTIKKAAPLAMFFVTAIYMLINIAYFSVVSKADILGSKRIIAALFFRNLYGPTTEKALSGFVALSVLGNLMAGQFAQGRVVQELGREGVLPYPAFFASNKPFNAPLAGLFAQYVVSCAFMIAPPPGDVYLFMITLSSYSSAIINTFVAIGLLLLYTPAFKKWNWNPPFRAPKPVIVLFCIVNLFLVVVPIIPPSRGSKVYEHLPYWSHILVAYLVSLLGISYWYVQCVWLPKRNGYKLERTWTVQDDGVPRYIFYKAPID